jgi:type I restriction enzyme M protein
MVLIEKDNDSLKNILPKHYSKQELDKTMLGSIVDIISTISMKDKDHG